MGAPGASAVAEGTASPTFQLHVLRFINWYHPLPGLSFAAPSASTNENAMNIDRFVFAFAGIVILIGTALGFYVHPYWLAVPAFVGLNLLQSAFKGFCPLALILRAFGMKSGCAFN